MLWFLKFKDGIRNVSNTLKSINNMLPKLLAARKQNSNWLTQNNDLTSLV